VELGVHPVEGDPQFAVEDKKDLFPIRSVSDAVEVGGDVETPGAQLIAPSGGGDIGAEPGAVRLECGRFC
jgi:hypothetical protein